MQIFSDTLRLSYGSRREELSRQVHRQTICAYLQYYVCLKWLQLIWLLFVLLPTLSRLAMPSTCLICKRTSGNQSNISMHCFPPVSQPVKRKQWLTALNLSDDDVPEQHRICSLHFPNGDISQTPSLHLGKRFKSPKKVWSKRAQRAAKRSKNVRSISDGRSRFYNQ